MRITTKQVEPIELLTELALKVILFLFILIGTAVLTGFYIYCVVNDKGAQAKAISGFGDLVFFAAFGKLVWNYFVRRAPEEPGAVSVITANENDSSRSRSE